MAQDASMLSLALQWPQQLNASLEEVDPDLFDIIEKEKNRQYKVSAASGRVVLTTEAKLVRVASFTCALLTTPTPYRVWTRLYCLNIHIMAKMVSHAPNDCKLVCHAALSHREPHTAIFSDYLGQTLLLCFHRAWS